MVTHPVLTLRQIQVDLFCAHGASVEEATVAADELIESSLMGYDSHGVMRCVQYANELRDGIIKPGAPIRIVKETLITATVDCGWNFGAVAATRMVEIACDKVKAGGLACVVSQNCQHVGRLGAWVTKLAARGLFGLAVVTNTRRGHQVVPWGGKEARLGTNPIAYAAPTDGSPTSVPIVMDMATCMIPEGKIRVLMHAGKPVPPNHILNAAGNPITDPKEFYGPPRGTILPFGGQYGHKGYGLGLLVEILGGALAGDASSQVQAHQNGLCLIAIDPDVFCGRERFIELMQDLRSYVTSAQPADGFDEVLLPGAPDFRLREKRLKEGIPLPEETWRQMREAAAAVGLMIRE
jgi:hydroxycarboxylate dehydrogenase B